MHNDERVGRGDDEAVKCHDGRVAAVLAIPEGLDDFHFIPSVTSHVSKSTQMDTSDGGRPTRLECARPSSASWCDEQP